jgi:glutamate--cysteine ligase
VHGADQSRLLVGSRHGQEAARSIAPQPVATALFANSPFTEAEQVHRTSRNLARHRCRPHRNAVGCSSRMGYERWVDYALDAPMYFVKHGDEYVDVAGQSFAI